MAGRGNSQDSIMQISMVRCGVYCIPTNGQTYGPKNFTRPEAIGNLSAPGFYKDGGQCPLPHASAFDPSNCGGSSAVFHLYPFQLCPGSRPHKPHPSKTSESFHPQTQGICVVAPTPTDRGVFQACNITGLRSINYGSLFSSESAFADRIGRCRFGASPSPRQRTPLKVCNPNRKEGRHV